MQKQSPMLRLWELGKDYHGGLIRAIFSAAVGVLCGLLPYFSAAQIIIGLLSGNAEIRFYILWCGLALAGFLLRAILYSLALSMSHKATFSILKNICEFYLERGIPFFLFAPSLTALSGKTTWDRMNHIVCDCTIEYENGATVKTSFITSFEPETVAETSPELTKLVNDTTEKLRQENARKLSKYDYPDHIVTAAMMQKMARYGVHFRVRREECQHVRSLDAQRAMKKTIYGAGLLLSDQAAARKQNAEKQAAEKAAEDTICYELSERERELVEELNKSTLY